MKAAVIIAEPEKRILSTPEGERNECSFLSISLTGVNCADDIFFPLR